MRAIKDIDSRGKQPCGYPCPTFPSLLSTGGGNARVAMVLDRNYRLEKPPGPYNTKKFLNTTSIASTTLTLIYTTSKKPTCFLAPRAQDGSGEGKRERTYRYTESPKWDETKGGGGGMDEVVNARS